MSVLRAVLAFFAPPAAVFLKVGIGSQFWINLLLTLLGWVPGVIHAIWTLSNEPGGL